MDFIFVTKSSLSFHVCSTISNCNIDGKLTHYVCVGHVMID